MTVTEFLKKEYNLNSLPNEDYKQYFTFNELIELLEKYRQVLNLPIANVSLSFVDWVSENYTTLKNHGDSLTLSELRTAYNQYTNEA
jgi:hypothetical protein